MNDDIRLKKQIKTDGWTNLLTGLGTSADKSKYTHAKNNAIISDDELEAIYADDGIGARIVDLLPEDMMKQGFSFEFENEKENMETISKKYDSILEAIHLHDKVSEAFKWARLYGGAIIVIGAFDGQDLSEPLNVKRIRAFENLKIIPRPNIDFALMEFQKDSSKPRFGEVEYYPISFRLGNDYRTARVHYSRVIEIHGIKVPYTGRANIPNEYRYWGLPILQRVKDSIANLGTSFGSISELMQEICVGKYKLKDLSEILSAPDGEKLVKNRVEVMDVTKSCFHSIIMDAEDEFIRDTISLGGVSEVLYQFMMVISASSGYPMTRLFGISPGGLNSTGDSDTYSYYDMVRAKQQLELKPVLNRIIGLIGEWQKLEIPEIKLNPLEQMTEKEQAELESQKAITEKTKMETYQGYIDMGIMEPYMVEELEFGDTLKNIELPEDYTLPPVDDIESLKSEIESLKKSTVEKTNEEIDEPDDSDLEDEETNKKSGDKK